MLRLIWQYVHRGFTRYRTGLDTADIQHLRADLRFRLAVVEYAYFGRSGRRVARSLEELKTLLGDKAIHRYLRSLDPELRTQFVERFQGAMRDSVARDDTSSRRSGKHLNTATLKPGHAANHVALASNVVPITQAARLAADPGPAQDDGVPAGNDSATNENKVAHTATPSTSGGDESMRNE